MFVNAHTSPLCVLKLAIWLQELAEQLEKANVELHGMDISPSNFPSQETLSKNIHLHVGSITQLPAEWTNKFDVVNQRFLIAGLLAKDWVTVLDEIFRVLKPGGVVQLVERECICPTNIKAGPIKQYYDLFEGLYKKKGLLRNCALEIPQMAKKAGFREITCERKICPVGKKYGEAGSMGVRTWGGAYRNLGIAVVRDGYMASAEEYERMVEGIESLWDRDGEEIGCRITCARKPL